MRSSFKTRMLGAAFGVTAIFGGVALADGASGISVTGNIALTTDYMFRSVSQNGSAPSVQGGFDATDGIFYVGTWAAAINFDPMEWDLYGGIRPTTGPISWDVGIIGYLYPDPYVHKPQQNYFEGYIKASTTVHGVGLGLNGFYSPNFFDETGDAYYFEGDLSFPLTKAISFSGALGYQDIGDVNSLAPGSPDGNYLAWNAGLTYTLGAYSFDIRYVDDNVAQKDNISMFTGSPENTNARAVFTIKKTL
jgi:uncharacterized protein (TIGR02001 family)